MQSDIIMALIITAIVNLAPALIIRYLIKKDRLASKKYAAITAGAIGISIYVVLSLVASDSGGPTGTPEIFWGIVNYFILKPKTVDEDDNSNNSFGVSDISNKKASDISATKKEPEKTYDDLLNDAAEMLETDNTKEINQTGSNSTNGNSKKDWGKGIPDYSQDDIMTEAELLNFAMNIVKQYELDKNGYKIIAANDNINVHPNFVVTKGDQLIMIEVAASIAPEMPVLSDSMRRQLLEKAREKNAVCYFAPVGFGACDGERFDKSLALRGDAFYSNYTGLELIK